MINESRLVHIAFLYLLHNLFCSSSSLPSTICKRQSRKENNSITFRRPDSKLPVLVHKGTDCGWSTCHSIAWLPCIAAMQTSPFPQARRMENWRWESNLTLCLSMVALDCAFAVRFPVSYVKNIAYWWKERTLHSQSIIRDCEDSSDVPAFEVASWDWKGENRLGVVESYYCSNKSGWLQGYATLSAAKCRPTSNC